MKAWLIRHKWWVAGAAIIVVVVAFNFQTIMLTTAFIIAERRPALLDDADWKRPSSARKFNAQFHRGTSVDGLTTWLKENKFNLDLRARRAQRRIGGVPCAENIQITWTSGPIGKIASAEVVVTEAGCL